MVLAVREGNPKTREKIQSSGIRNRQENVAYSLIGVLIWSLFYL